VFVFLEGLPGSGKSSVFLELRHRGLPTLRFFDFPTDLETQAFLRHTVFTNPGTSPAHRAVTMWLWALLAAAEICGADLPGQKIYVERSPYTAAQIGSICMSNSQNETFLRQSLQQIGLHIVVQLSCSDVVRERRLGKRGVREACAPYPRAKMGSSPHAGDTRCRCQSFFHLLHYRLEREPRFHDRASTERSWSLEGR
jgi:thymidylate kinase